MVRLSDVAPGTSMLTRTWRPGRPVALETTLGALRRGAGDPTYRIGPGGPAGAAPGLWRSMRTPEGSATVRLVLRRDLGEVEASAWGAGAGWALATVPSSLGSDDDPRGFVPRHPLLVEMARRHPGWRVPRTRLVLESLVPAVLEQKVTGTEAWRAWRWLLRRYGEPAPGPAPAGMWVPPDAATWRQVPSWDWHRAGVDAKRSRTVLAVVTVAARLQETVDLPLEEVEHRLRLVPGIGVWTAAEVRQRAHGDPDAVSVGDFHLPAVVGNALAGKRVDDDGMLELLEPYAGHRYRAVRLIELSGVRPQRRGPRLAPRDFRAM